MSVPLINRHTIALLIDGRLDADAQAELGEMLALAIDAPSDAAAALGLEYSAQEKLAQDAARDAVVCEAAASLPPRLMGKSRLISSAFLDYHSGGWDRHCSLRECPQQVRGLDRFAWKAFRLFDSTRGLSARNIRRILATDRGDGQLDDL